MVKATYEQTFIGIWFHDKKLPIDQQDKMKLYLNRTFYYYHIFVDTLNFYEYIKKKPVTKIFLIISISDLSLFSLVELAKEYPQFFEKFYIFLSTNIITSACFNTTNIDDLFTEISNNINDKINPLNRAEDELHTEPKPITTSHINKDPPSLSVFNSKLTQAMLIRHLTKESLKFVSFLIMRDILIRERYGTNELVEMCATCRSLHDNDEAELKNIDELQLNYDPNKVVQYYTKSGFLFRTINQVCGTENIEDIYKFRIYISDLHRKLNQLDVEQKDNIKPYIEKLYRGKPIAGSVLQQLVDNKGGLISMNGFLSTTIDRDVALRFVGYLDNKDQGIKSTLFLLKIDKVNQPYAYISNNSEMQDELEVLFSLGTIWHIESIILEEDLCTIELISCEKLDSELARLLEKYTGENVSLISLSDILLEFGDESEAEWCYRKMLDQQSNDDETTGILYYKIGMIQFEKKLYSEALTNLTKAEVLLRQLENKVNETTSSRPIYIYCTGPPLLKIHSNIGFLLEKNGKFEEAAACYEQALNKNGSDLELATVHNNLGLVYFHLGNYTKAEVHYKEACRLIGDSHLWSREFNDNLKRTQKQLDYIEKIKEKTKKNQKTTIDVLVYENSAV